MVAPRTGHIDPVQPGRRSGGADRIPIRVVIAHPAAELCPLVTRAPLLSVDHEITLVHRAAEAVVLARGSASDPPRLVIVGLAFGPDDRSGLDVLRAWHRWCPESSLVLSTTGTGPELELARQAWHRIRPLSVLSDRLPVTDTRRRLDDLVRTGIATVEPRLRPLLDRA